MNATGMRTTFDITELLPTSYKPPTSIIQVELFKEVLKVEGPDEECFQRRMVTSRPQMRLSDKIDCGWNFWRGEPSGQISPSQLLKPPEK